MVQGGGATTGRAVLKGRSIRRVENHQSMAFFLIVKTKPLIDLKLVISVTLSDH